MFQNDSPAKPPLFTYFPSQGERPIGLVSVPHSGEDIPPEFLKYLAADLKTMREDVDFKVDTLIDIPQLQSHGIGVLVAHVHRVCVDLNRAPENSVLCWQENTKGVRLVSTQPSDLEREDLINRYHVPFFEIYATLLRELARQLPGGVPVIDLHSMPSAPTAYHLKQNPRQSTHRPDFCLSDQKGKTCSPAFIGHFAQALRALGHETFVNDPYIGGYVTTFVDGFPTNNIQIEINRHLYMNEQTKEMLVGPAALLKERLTAVICTGLGAFAR